MSFEPAEYTSWSKPSLALCDRVGSDAISRALFNDGLCLSSVLELSGCKEPLGLLLISLSVSSNCSALPGVVAVEGPSASSTTIHPDLTATESLAVATGAPFASGSPNCLLASATAGGVPQRLPALPLASDPRERILVWSSSWCAPFQAPILSVCSHTSWRCARAPWSQPSKLASTLVRIGNDGFKLLSLERVWQQEGMNRTASPPQQEAMETTAQRRRERENAEVIGGLRDPRRAVARCKELQQVGRQIRQLLDQSLTDDILTCFENSVDECPFPEWLIWKARYSLTRHFEAEAKDEGYQSDLLRQLLTQAKDPDATVLPAWIEDGFPIGINQQITYTGVFPRSDDLTAAAKASQAFAVMDDWDGKAQNYSSFADAGDKAQCEVDRMVERGWALRKDTWADVVATVGDASLTKMACIVKMKQGREKVRIIVDMRRSGVNGGMSVHERVVLPRASDVAKCLGELLKHAGRHDVPEFYIIDFSDAFYTLKLHPSERSHTVVKGNDGRYYILLSVCFGLCCGPLVWGRLAAALLRLGQATMESREGRSQCYADDPLLVAIGPSTRARSAVFARVTLLWCCLGATLAWKKVQRGPKVEWIGVALHLEGERYETLRVSLTPEKTQRLFELFQEIFEAGRNGMISTRRLSQAAGIMGWVSNLVPVARPWTAALWGALTTASQEGASVRSTTRHRKGLTFWKQVSWAITGLRAMLVVGAHRSHEPVVNLSPILDSPTPIPEVPCSLSKVFLFGDHLPLCELWTDACPGGVGSFICFGTKPRGFYMHQLTEQDAWWVDQRCVCNDPSWQSEWELFAVLLAFRAFHSLLKGGAHRVFLRSDNVSTLLASLEFKAHSPALNRIAGELALEIESLELAPLEGRHVRGLLNTDADDLSRGTVPRALIGVERFSLTEAARLFERCA